MCKFYATQVSTGAKTDSDQSFLDTILRESLWP